MKVVNFEIQVDRLKQCLEDITSVCILEGFQKQEHLVMVDSVLKELGRAEACLACKSRQPVLTSTHFIAQYLPASVKIQFLNLWKRRLRQILMKIILLTECLEV